MFGNRIYWKTQWVLKRKWLLNKWPFGRNRGFQRFVILCHPRTGSTWLHTLLNSSMQIKSYGEVLTERKNIKSLEHAIWSDHHPSIQAIGCKIFYEQLGEKQFSHVLDELVLNQNIKIIDLYREDTLAAFSSFKVAQRSGVWSRTLSRQNEDSQVLVEEEELSLYVQKLEANRNRMLQKLVNHDVFSLSYEDIFKSQETTLITVQKFLGVLPTPLFSLIRKQTLEDTSK